jgi:protein-disulfide isomerase
MKRRNNHTFNNNKIIIFGDILFIISILGLLTIILIGITYHIGVLALAQGNINTNNTNNNISLSTLIKEGSPHLGSVSAPITVIDFSDFQCHLCARYVKATEPEINKTYIQTGKVNLVFKHLPNRGSDSMGVAIAAQCTNDQGKFWQFHNLLYKNQGPIDSGWVNKDNLKKFASQLKGLDMQKFNSCFNSQKYNPFVESDLTLAHSLGFTQTPSFIIVKSDGSNPQQLLGPQPFPEFKLVIDKELGGA